MDNLAKFVEKNRGKEIDGLFVCLIVCYNYSFFLAIVEYVRDGSTMRVILLPSFEMVTVMMSGIKVTTLRGLRSIVHKLRPATRIVCVIVN